MTKEEKKQYRKFEHINLNTIIKRDTIENNIRELLNVTYLKPTGFLYKQHAVKCNTWTSLFIAMVKILHEENQNILRNFVKTNQKYISDKKLKALKNMRRPIVVFGPNLVIEANRPAKYIVRTIYQCLKEYQSVKHLKIFVH